MSSQYFFRTPFAASGDVAPIPVEAPVDGSVSYTSGWGGDYELDPTSDPDAKRIPRDQTNQLNFAITENLRQYQLFGAPEWVTSAQNGGSAVSYARGVYVWYDAGAGLQLWGSIAATNTAVPGADPTKWLAADVFSFSLVAAAANYTTPSSNSLLVSPARLATALRENRMLYAAATRIGAAYTLTLAGAAFVLTPGAQVEFTVPDASPAGPLTLNVNALGAAALVNSTGGDFAAADLQPNRAYTARYGGSSWAIVQGVASQFATPVTIPDRLVARTTDVDAVTDLNAVTENGWYRAAAGVTNGPSSLSAVAIYVEVRAVDANNVVQTARGQTGASEADTRTWQRTRIGGTWGPWFRLLQTATEQQQNALPPGFEGSTYGNSAPNGWLLCDGSAVSRSTYAALFTVIGTVWGAGNGTTTFNLPNRLADGGYFSRPGTPNGVLYADTVGPHVHSVSPPPRNSEGGDGYTVAGGTGVGETILPYNTAFNTGAGTETVPKHVRVLPIIKY